MPSAGVLHLPSSEMEAFQLTASDEVHMSSLRSTCFFIDNRPSITDLHIYRYFFGRGQVMDQFFDTPSNVKHTTHTIKVQP